MPTIESIASSLAAPLGENYSDYDIKESFDTWVAEALDEVLGDDEWPFQRAQDTITTVASTATYDSPSNIWDVERVARSGGYGPLEQITRRELMNRGLDLTEEGTPSHWYPNGVDTDQNLQIAFWPVPSGVLTYIVSGGVLTNADASTPTTNLTLPPDIVSLIKNLVREQYYMHSGQAQVAAVERGRFRRRLPEVRKRHMHIGDPPRRAHYRDVPERGGRFLRMPSNF